MKLSDNNYNYDVGTPDFRHKDNLDKQVRFSDFNFSL